MQQERNLDQLSTAQLRQTYCNANVPKNHPGFPDVGTFLPHPLAWKLFSTGRKIQVSKVAALEFLATYQDYSTDVEIAFDHWLTDIQAAAIT